MEASPSPELVQELARAATGRATASVAEWTLQPAGHRVENLTTNRLDRLAGTLDDGTAWSVFAKTLQPASDSSQWSTIPSEFHAAVLEDLDWLGEVRVYRGRLAHDLPDGLRLPVVHRIDETPTRITIWMEDVADDPAWDLDRYHRAARALGRLGGWWPDRRARDELGMGRRPLERLFHGKISHLDLPLQADDRFWAAASIASVVDPRHRDDLRQLAAATPELLRRVGQLPHGMAHGDATPENLRLPSRGAIVAIDWSYGCCAPLGSDLGQLLAGRTEAGLVERSPLADIASAVVDGYLAGLSDEGRAVRRADVEEAFATHLAVRTVFSALIVDHRPDLDEPARCELLARRARLGRFGLDLVARTAASG